jgi:hypothetical protein
MLADETESGPNFGFVTAPLAKFWVVTHPVHEGPNEPPPLVLVAVVIGCWTWVALGLELEPAAAGVGTETEAVLMPD